jgi:hypothetical protein
MADAQTLGDLTFPDTQPYRVLGVGATYYAPVATVGGDGKPTVVLSYRVGARGEQIDLTADQAERLEGLGAVKPWDDPLSYDEMDDDALRSAAASRGVLVPSSGADSDKPLRTDFINALNSYDLGQDAAVVGVTTVPGGVVNLGAADLGDAGGSYSARGRSATEVTSWIESEKPNAGDTVAAAGGDPETAKVVLEAENTATGQDPRKSVEKQLQAIIDGDGQ